MEQLAALHQYSDLALFLLRVAIALIFLVHGIWKVRHGKQVAEALGMPDSGWFFTSLGVAETLGALGLLSGFLTQFAAAGLALIMLGAIYFKVVPWKVPFTAHDKTGWEFDMMILAGCIAIVIMGAGKVALDRLVFGLF